MYIPVSPVTSSNLAAVGYDEATETLRVAFRSGSVYDYFNVPADVYEELLSAPSKGHYHYFNIRQSFAFQEL